jgi:hypothetical protein
MNCRASIAGFAATSKALEGAQGGWRVLIDVRHSPDGDQIRGAAKRRDGLSRTSRRSNGPRN